MATLEKMQEQLEALREARASGVRRVEYEGRGVEYRSDAEIAAAIADIERRIAALSRTTPSFVHISTSKGLRS